VLATMKIALLGTGFGQAHAAVYAKRPDVGEVIVFGRSLEKLAKIDREFGFPTSTDLDGLISDGSVDLVDICLPTRLHADVAIRAMQAGKRVLIELPLAASLEDARRIVTAHKATGQMAFVDMFSRFSPANQQCARQSPTTFRHAIMRTPVGDYPGDNCQRPRATRRDSWRAYPQLEPPIE
jgi:predicted dehydrogenase